MTPGKRAAFVCIAILFSGFVTQQATANPLAENPPAPVLRPPAKFLGSSNDDAADKVRDADKAKGELESEINSLAGMTQDSADRRKIYRALLKKEAEKNGLPPDIADSVAAIESGYDPGVVGSAGEIGLMQVLPGTAAMLGFKGDLTELAKPEINIHFGVTYLAEAWRLANGDLCRALMKYRAGHGEENMSALSATYCSRALAHLAAIGSPFANGVSAPVAIASAPIGLAPIMPRRRALRRGPPIRTAAVSRAFWATHEARVKAITAQIEARWRRVASR